MLTSTSFVFTRLRRSPDAAGTKQMPKHSDDEDDDDDSEDAVYRPNLHLEDVAMLHDPATAPAAYRKAMSSWFSAVFFSFGFYHISTLCTC